MPHNKITSSVATLEALDSRTLLASVSWDGGGDGTSWMDANNWSSNALPTASDDVTISVAGNPSITIPSGTAMANTLACQKTLTINANLTVTSATFNTTVNWLDGNLTGAFTLSSGATANLTGSGSRKVSSSVSPFTNNGIINYSGSGLSLGSGITFDNHGTFNLTGTGDISQSGTGTPNFNNHGTFNKTTSGTVSNFNSVVFNNTGTLNLVTGGINFGKGGSTTAPLTVPAGASMTFDSLDNVDFDFDVGGTVLGGAGTITLTSGTLRFNQPNSTVNNLHMNDGSLVVATGNTLTFDGTLNFAGGDLAGSFVIVNGATANFSNAGNKTIQPDTTLRNDGTINYSGAADLTFKWNTTLENYGTFNLAGTGHISRSSAGPATFNNFGVFNKTSVSASGFDNVTFNNPGTLNVNAGTLSGDDNSPVNGGGAINVAAGAVFNAHSIMQDTAHISGRINLSSDSVASRVAILTLAGNGTIDIGGNGLIVDYTGSSPINTINSQIASAYNNGAWNGVGIDSSVIDSNPGSQIGFGESSQLVGAGGGTWVETPVDGSAVLIRTTLGGDANLSRVVDFNDLLIVAQNYGTTGKLFTQGNFNYSSNGSVDFNDLLILAQNYGNNFSHGPMGMLFSSNRIRNEVVI